MEEYERLVERQRKWMLYLLVFFLIGASITSHQRIFLSLLLGYVVGYYSLRFLQSRIKAFGRAVVEKGSSANLGTFIRLGGIAVVAVMALRFPEKVHLLSVIAGIGIAYVILFFDFTLQAIAADKESRS